MSDRDTLAALIRPHLDHLVGGMAAAWQAEQIADAVLAGGWRAPGPVYVNLRDSWDCSHVVTGVYTTKEAAEAAPGAWGEETMECPLDVYLDE